jgi:hypothetical protein
MKQVGIILLFCGSVASSSAQAVECLNAPNRSESGWWSWREIDGRKCWYIKNGAVPPKSEFEWPEREKEAPRTETPELQEPALIAAGGANTTSLPRIEAIRVKPVEIRESIYRLRDGGVRLLDGSGLAGPNGIGGFWEMPASIKSQADTFEARYGEWVSTK